MGDGKSEKGVGLFNFWRGIIVLRRGIQRREGGPRSVEDRIGMGNLL